MKTKICSNPKCLQPEKSILEFGKDKSRKDGLYCYCKQCVKECTQKNKEKISKYGKEYYLKYRNRILQRVQKYQFENPEKTSQYKKDWADKNREKVNGNRKDRRENNINFKILCNLRTRIYNVLKGNSKSKKTLELLGCTIEELKKHLENQFKNGMAWGNYGLNGWEMDHIKPCNSFNLSNPNQQKECFHYSNLQPLWAKENRSKSDKILK